MSLSEAPAPQERLSTGEFIALMAMLFGTLAFTIDAMLPALPEIADELSPENLNRTQLIVTSFVLGMGLGTFVTGPLSDAFGRKPVIIGAAGLFCISAAVAWWAQSLEVMLVARLIQGLGAAGPRVVALAMIRDLFVGREMAKIMSFVFLIFSLVPAIAPTVGAGILAIAGWRAIFPFFILFSGAATIWLWVRQPETLPPEGRKPMKAASFVSAIKEVFSIPMVRLSIAIQALCMGILFGLISSTQQIYDVIFDQGHLFHFWFGATAILASSASIVNAAMVVRLGMRYLITLALGSQIIFSMIMLVLSFSGILEGEAGLWLWFAWSTTIFFMVGLTLGNLNALALEPLGHIAGMASSITSSVSTVAGVAFAVPVGLLFNETLGPLAVGTLAYAVIGFFLIRRMARLERVAVAAEA